MAMAKAQAQAPQLNELAGSPAEEAALHLPALCMQQLAQLPIARLERAPSSRIVPTICRQRRRSHEIASGRTRREAIR